MFKLNASYPPLRSARARRVAGWFGITAARPRGADELLHARPPQLRELLPPPGTITLITGPSGSGKSSLLRALREVAAGGIRWIDLDEIGLPEKPLVDCFSGVSLEQTLSLLARVGLGDAWTYLRTPGELSAGQRWRAKVAVALGRTRWAREAASGGGARRGNHDHPSILSADEFAAMLDRVTAMIVARALRRIVRTPLSALLATSHDDLIAALMPDRVIRCDFGRVDFVQQASVTRTS